MKSLLWLALAAAAAKAELTPQRPAVEVSRDRAEIVLNGVGRFQPATTATEPDPAGWGEMPSPGTWVGDSRIRLPGNPERRGTSEAWKSYGRPLPDTGMSEHHRGLCKPGRLPRRG